MSLTIKTMTHSNNINNSNNNNNNAKQKHKKSVSYYNIPTGLLQDFFVHLVGKDVRLTLISKLLNYLQELL